ncbi:MAG TPA: hypothetical protein VK586_22375 [Streptosporangiaceae bacterium]|nr:hypothetical protein [Streptosporangiaceae bacterium]
MICADGFNGHAERSPYDAIISTAAVTRLPKPWLTQTRPGSRIITPLRGAIAVIDVHGPGQATGRFLPEPVQILPLRTSQAHVLDEPAPDNASVPKSASVITSFRDPRFR